MKKALILTLILLLIIPYLLLVNFISLEIYNIEQSGKITQGNEIGVNDQVGVQVLNEKFYGTIVKDYNPKNRINNLYLFNFLKIPISINGFPLFILHFLFLGIIFISFLSVLLFYKEAKDEQMVKGIVNPPI